MESRSVTVHAAKPEAMSLARKQVVSAAFLSSVGFRSLGGCVS